MTKELIIYTDESVKTGFHYSNFYGGALVRSEHIDLIRTTLEQVKSEQNLYNEVKWARVTEQYLPKYEALINQFFSFVKQDQIKVRIMFTDNRRVPLRLTSYQREHGYFLLYYQFIKHAFGLQYIEPRPEPRNLRIYLDKVPDHRDKVAQFRSFLVGLNKTPEFRRANITLHEDQIAEIDSEHHVILQCLDIVMGAMQFRLNDLHLVKPEGAKQRGKRTIAKEKLYKLINRHIREIYPHFNIGLTTGKQGGRLHYWLHPYRHWVFVPTQSDYVIEEE